MSVLRTTISATALCFIFVATGCRDRSADAALKASIAADGAAYVLSDTMPYEDNVSSGTMALLHRNGVFIDSVDVAFGVPRVGRDSVLFLPVRSASGATGVTTSITDHVLFDGTNRKLLKDIVPHFDSHFSSPAMLAGALYYWGFFQSTGIDSVQAVRYEFKRKRLNQLPLPATFGGTDDRFYFTPPFLDRKEFVFKSAAGEWRFRTPRQR